MSKTTKRYPTAPTTFFGKLNYYIPKVRTAAEGESSATYRSLIEENRELSRTTKDPAARSWAQRRIKELEGKIEGTNDPARAAELLIHLEAAFQIMSDAEALPMFHIKRTKKEAAV
jgi:hypothetical protein